MHLQKPRLFPLAETQVKGLHEFGRSPRFTITLRASMMRDSGHSAARRHRGTLLLE